MNPTILESLSSGQQPFNSLQACILITYQPFASLKLDRFCFLETGQIFGSFLGFIIVGHLYYTGSSLVAAKTLQYRKMLAQYDVLVLGATGFTGQVRSMSSNMPLPKLNNLYKSL